MAMLIQSRVKRRESVFFFGDDLEGHDSGDFLVEADFCFVFANHLGGFEVDDLAVYFVAEFEECLGDLSCAYGAIDIAVGGSLGCNHGANAFESGGGSLGFLQDGGTLVGLLTLVLRQHFKGCVRCDDAQSLRYQVVAAIAVLYLYDVILITQARDVLLKNYFHLYGALKVIHYFMRSVT